MSLSIPYVTSHLRHVIHFNLLNSQYSFGEFLQSLSAALEARLVTEVSLRVVDVIQNLDVFKVGIAAEAHAHGNLEHFAVKLAVVKNEMGFVKETLKDSRCVGAGDVHTLLVIDRNVQPLYAVSRETDACDLNLDLVDQNPVAGLGLLDVGEDACVKTGRLGVNCDDWARGACPRMMPRVVGENLFNPSLKLLGRCDETENLLGHPRFLDALNRDAAQLLAEDTADVAGRLHLLRFWNLLSLGDSWLASFLGCLLRLLLW